MWRGNNVSSIESDHYYLGLQLSDLVRADRYICVISLSYMNLMETMHCIQCDEIRTFFTLYVLYCWSNIKCEKKKKIIERTIITIIKIIDLNHLVCCDIRYRVYIFEIFNTRARKHFLLFHYRLLNTIEGNVQTLFKTATTNGLIFSGLYFVILTRSRELTRS